MATATKKKPAKTAKPRTAKPKAAKPAKVKAKGDKPSKKRESLIDAAYEVLLAAGEAMKPIEIVTKAVEKKLWTPKAGKTPEATLSSAIRREIEADGRKARFKKTGPNQFVAIAAA